MNNVVLQSQNHSNTTKNVVQSISSDEYLASFGGNLPSLVKDILAQINYPCSSPVPAVSDSVNFGEFYANELPQPKKKCRQKSDKGAKGGVGFELGNTTKSASALTGGDIQKRINYLEFVESSFTPINAKFNYATGNLGEKEVRRSVRYKLLQISQLILPSNHRVNSCLRYRIIKDENVKILQHTEHGCLHYGNLMRCGSVWLCPVCGSKISEVRRLELQQAKGEWLKMGGHVYMLTLTTPHYSFTDLKELIDGQAKALRYFWGGRSAEQLKADLGLVGQIRAFEITYGDENGFHPHYHILLFTKVDLLNGFIYKKFADRFSEKWADSCVKAGLPRPSDEHGCHLQDGSKAFEYINKYGQDDDELPMFDGFASVAKSRNPKKIFRMVDEKERWNSSHEMTKSHLKKGKEGRLTPHDFLRLYNENPQKYGALWTTYANGVRGKAQLFWSRGLKELLGIKKNNDSAIANNENVSELVGDNNDLAIINATQKLSEIVYEVDLVAWQYVIKHRKQHHILMLCKYDLLNGTAFLTEYLSALVEYEKSLLEKDLADSPPKPKLSVKALKQMKVAEQFEQKYGGLAELNPYPNGSPSWESWEKKYGNK